MAKEQTKPEQPPKKIIKEEKGLEPAKDSAPMPKVIPPKKESDS
jgi:hypothetical protein